jgi:hypothetical protein
MRESSLSDCGMVGFHTAMTLSQCCFTLHGDYLQDWSYYTTTLLTTTLRTAGPGCIELIDLAVFLRFSPQRCAPAWHSGSSQC